MNFICRVMFLTAACISLYLFRILLNICPLVGNCFVERDGVAMWNNPVYWSFNNIEKLIVWV